MAKHTQGQWVCKVARNGDVGLIAPGTGVFAEFFVDIRHPHENNRAEALANAKIAVAALDLLAALKDCEARLVLLVDQGRGKMLDAVAAEKAKAAIAKAEG